VNTWDGGGGRKGASRLLKTRKKKGKTHGRTQKGRERGLGLGHREEEGKIITGGCIYKGTNKAAEKEH